MRQEFGLHHEDWPRQWRDARDRANAPCDSLFGDGAATKRLRPATLRLHWDTAGHLLRHTSTFHPERLNGPPSAMISMELVQDWVNRQIERGVGNNSLRMRLSSLCSALRLLWPQLNFEYLRRPGGRSLASLFPGGPRIQKVSSHYEMLERVKQIHSDGLLNKGCHRGLIALRDAALLGVLFCHGVRARTLHETQLGTNLEFRQGGYWLVYVEDNTKNIRRYEVPLPQFLTPILDDYLHLARHQLGGDATPALWMSTQRQPLSRSGFVGIVRRHTKAWTGTAHGPHWARKCITTTIRLESPELARDTAIVLDHSPQVAQKHYDMSTGIPAAVRHNKRVEQRIRDTARRAELAFKHRTDPDPAPSRTQRTDGW